jgi:hypothetical protein
MDTSETYIKMCDCEEIQEHKPDSTWADWWASIPMIGTYKHNVFAKLDTKRIWLPRQDQLQEMVGQLDTETWVLKKIYDWAYKYDGHYKDICYTQYTRQFRSMEQLWLAFVMKEKFNKTWDGEKWIGGR